MGDEEDAEEDWGIDDDKIYNDHNQKGTNKKRKNKEQEDEKNIDKDDDKNNSDKDAVRDKKIELLRRFFEHAVTCESASCPSKQCKKMKKLISHSQRCQIKKEGGCNRCTAVWYLSKYHAQDCNNANCSVPFCISSRQSIEQIQEIKQ